MIKISIVANHAFFAVVTFSKIKFFAYINFYYNTAFIVSNLWKDFHQDNLIFVYLQFYNYSCLNILAGNICFRMQVKNQ